MSILERLFNGAFKPKAKDLTEPQAEGGLAGVRKSFVESAWAGMTPEKLAGILKECDEGEIEQFMMLAEELEEKDPHYASVMGQRKRAVSGVKPTVTPFSEDAKDVEIAEWVEQHIATHDGFTDLVEELLDAVGKGFSVVEIMWATDKTSWWPEEFIWRTQRFFQFDIETGRELRLRDEDDPNDGVELQPFKYLKHRAKLKSGQVFRGGVARVVVFGIMCKAYSVKDWMAFVETYGLPIRLGRYGAEATKDDVNLLFRAVANIGTDAAAVIPKHMDIDFVDNKSGNGSQPIFENLARFVDEQTSKLVLGQTMTTDDGSSQAQANVHNDVRHDIAAADARSITSTINRDLVVPAVLFNFGPVAGFPKVSIEIDEPEDIQIMVNAITSLSSAGVTFKMSEARRKVRMSDPEDGDEVFGGASAPAPDPKETAREKHLARQKDEADDLIDEIAALGLDEWEPVMGEMLEPFTNAIETATTYEEARANLAKIDGFPVSKLVDQLVISMFAARAAGDVQDG